MKIQKAHQSIDLDKRKHKNRRNAGKSDFARWVGNGGFHQPALDDNILLPFGVLARISAEGHRYQPVVFVEQENFNLLDMF